MAGWMAGCWVEKMVVMRVGLRAKWMAARMAAQKAGWMAVRLAGLMVDSTVG